MISESRTKIELFGILQSLKDSNIVKDSVGENVPDSDEEGIIEIKTKICDSLSSTIQKLKYGEVHEEILAKNDILNESVGALLRK